MTKGIITIATGKPQYIDMAIALGISASLHSPGISKAVVTDSDNPLLAGIYDQIIKPIDGYDGFRLKTSLYDLTPFEETIFIDSDCLVVSDVDEIFNKCKEEDFVVIGGRINSGYWFTDIPNLLKKLKLESIPKFNSGFIYFKKNAVSRKVFQEAQSVFNLQEYYEIEKFKNSCPDEPCISIGMAKAGVDSYKDDERKFSYDPIGLQGRFYVDAIKGEARWTIRGIGEVRPAIVHFVSRTNYQEYRTECLRLRWHYAGGWKKIVMPAAAFVVYWLTALRRNIGNSYHKLILKDR
jgi:hypothetical protein